MKKAIRNLGLMLLLCAPMVAMAQTRTINRVNHERAMQIGASVKQTIKTKEPGWKWKLNLESEFGTHDYFRSGTHELDISILVYDSPAEASRQLAGLARSSSITAEQELKGFGDEAYYMSDRYFSWVGVRKGNMVVAVRGPGPELTVTRRFVRYGLQQLAEK